MTIATAASWFSNAQPLARCYRSCKVLCVRKILRHFGALANNVRADCLHPFYVMVMTSLTSRQTCSILRIFDRQCWCGGSVQSMSSCSKYDFGILLNSAIISVATVLITLIFSVPGAPPVAKPLSRSQMVVYAGLITISSQRSFW